MRTRGALLRSRWNYIYAPYARVECIFVRVLLAQPKTRRSYTTTCVVKFIARARSLRNGSVVVVVRSLCNNRARVQHKYIVAPRRCPAARPPHYRHRYTVGNHLIYRTAAAAVTVVVVFLMSHARRTSAPKHARRKLPQAFLC